MTLDELQRIKQWHLAHKEDHPLEYHLWDLILTIWVLGWVAWLPAVAFGHEWIALMCLSGLLVPGRYVRWRTRAHQQQRLRCDWIDDPR